MNSTWPMPNDYLHFLRFTFFVFTFSFSYFVLCFYFDFYLNFRFYKKTYKCEHNIKIHSPNIRNPTKCIFIIWFFFLSDLLFCDSASDFGLVFVSFWYLMNLCQWNNRTSSKSIQLNCNPILIGRIFLLEGRWFVERTMSTIFATISQINETEKKNICRHRTKNEPPKSN